MGRAAGHYPGGVQYGDSLAACDRGSGEKGLCQGRRDRGPDSRGASWKIGEHKPVKDHFGGRILRNIKIGRQIPTEAQESAVLLLNSCFQKLYMYNYSMFVHQLQKVKVELYIHLWKTPT